MQQQHIHFIGICGVAMSALAIAFQKNGWRVTGSDAGFFPPVSTALENAGIAFYPGWHPERMLAEGAPDIVVVGNVASSTNPEFLAVIERHIPYLSYPELVAQRIIRANSIVSAGTYGKSSTAALLAWMLSRADMRPSYLFGGLAVEEFPSAAIADGLWSVAEGDEYKSARWDTRPKFAHYAPTHLLLTGLSWDHADVYPTEASYLNAFETLIASVPDTGIIAACADDANIVRLLSGTRAPRIWYGASAGDYRYARIRSSADGIAFDILAGAETFAVQSPLLGAYQAANITGAFAMARAIGIAPDTLLAAIRDFRGLKRRLEKRLDGPVAVFDDIAHSPAKARSAIAAIRAAYAGKITVVFEPNTGNRKTASAPSYADAFAGADDVIIPALTKIKKDPNDPDAPMESNALAAVIAQTHPRARSVPDDAALVRDIACAAAPGDAIMFCGSHGFRGMIDETVICLRQRFPQ